MAQRGYKVVIPVIQKAKFKGNKNVSLTEIFFFVKQEMSKSHEIISGSFSLQNHKEIIFINLYENNFEYHKVY